MPEIPRSSYMRVLLSWWHPYPRTLEKENGENLSILVVCFHYDQLGFWLFFYKKSFCGEYKVAWKLNYFKKGGGGIWNILIQGFWGIFWSIRAGLTLQTASHFAVSCINCIQNCALFMFTLLFLETELVIVKGIQSKNHTASVTILFGNIYISEASCSALWYS